MKLKRITWTVLVHPSEVDIVEEELEYLFANSDASMYKVSHATEDVSAGRDDVLKFFQWFDNDDEDWTDER